MKKKPEPKPATPAVVLRRHFKTSVELREYVREQSGDTCILSFSRGKDSIAAWIALRPHFKRIVPFFLYGIPDLEFIENSLRYFEKRFRTKIIRLPHPSLYRKLHNMVFQPHERGAIIDQQEQAGRLDPVDYDVLERYVRHVTRAPNAFIALGTRTADSPIRLANANLYGQLNPTRRSFWAVFDWKIADVCDCFRREGIKLPVDYDMFGRSFDGIDYRFLRPIRDRFPKDYAKIIEWFPLAELEFKRREWSPHRKEVSK